jgi:hypothetical protein
VQLNRLVIEEMEDGVLLSTGPARSAPPIRRRGLLAPEGKAAPHRSSCAAPAPVAPSSAAAEASWPEAGRDVASSSPRLR